MLSHEKIDAVYFEFSIGESEYPKKTVILEALESGKGWSDRRKFKLTKYTELMSNLWSYEIPIKIELLPDQLMWYIGDIITRESIDRKDLPEHVENWEVKVYPIYCERV